jgi:phthalate 4,5-cis-dihydrodiol dehydrogenase
MSDRKLRLGIAGLGRGFSVMLPTLALHPKLEVAAAVDTRDAALDRFKADFGGTPYASYAEMCGNDSLDAIYVATPHQFHEDHVIAAARAGKHVLVEKPMALTVDACTRMIEASEKAGVHLLVGHSHSFDAPILAARRLIASGKFGTPKMITALNYTDFIYRPRRPEELNTTQGGGVVFSQGAHQIDIARLLAGGMAESVYAVSGNWDPSRPTEGAYTALIRFAGDAFASLTYNGYGRFDSDEFTDWIGEMGRLKDPANYGAGRAALREVPDVDSEAALKAARAYGGPKGAGFPAADFMDGKTHEHFGTFIVSCERGDIRPMPDRVELFGEERETIPLALPTVPRSEVIDELYAAVFANVPPLHSGKWGRATLEVCLANIESARTRREVKLAYQLPVNDFADAEPL